MEEMKQKIGEDQTKLGEKGSIERTDFKVNERERADNGVGKKLM